MRRWWLTRLPGKERDNIIDHPDRTISVDEYRARIADAQHNCQTAHRNMMEAWG